MLNRALELRDASLDIFQIQDEQIELSQCPAHRLLHSAVVYFHCPFYPDGAGIVEQTGGLAAILALRMSLVEMVEHLLDGLVLGAFFACLAF